MNTDDRIIDFVLLGIIIGLIILKVTNIITLSWAILLIPIWICLLIVAICIGLYIVAIIINLFRNIKER